MIYAGPHSPLPGRCRKAAAMIHPATTPGTQGRPLPPRPRGVHVPRWVRLLLGATSADETDDPLPASYPEHRDPPPGVTCRCYPR
jgi:hypothetical protein